MVFMSFRPPLPKVDFDYDAACSKISEMTCEFSSFDFKLLGEKWYEAASECLLTEELMIGLVEKMLKEHHQGKTREDIQLEKEKLRSNQEDSKSIN